MLTSWPCPASGGGTAPEYALALDRARKCRLLVVPALFDEANRLRRFTVTAMRALNVAGIDTFLPDLPGCNESTQPLASATLAQWRSALAAAATHFGATHVLALRGGALIAPDLPGWAYAPLKGETVLRQMLRMRVLSSREAGREEQAGELLTQGRAHGLDLAGYRLGPDMIAGLETALPTTTLTEISQGNIGGGGLWLRAEPDEAPDQSQALADLIARSLQC